MQVTSSVRQPLVTGGKTYHDVTHDVSRQVEGKPSKLWFLAFLTAAGVLALGSIALLATLWEGIGMWGLNKTVGWAWDITNFVWWVGIGHAGTLISAVLLLFRQKWRTSINRAAEAMTIFAVICAAMFPVIHMGRPWLGAFWALPLPNTYGSLWVNFNSPLLWDVFAISTYFSVSLVFWYIGLIPDFATIRDRATGLRKIIYGALSFGWDGAAKTWMRYESVSLILAGLATPLVLSVHTIVSFDFATSVIPGWHTTTTSPWAKNQLDSTIKIAKSKTLSQCDILPTVWSLLGSSNGKSNVQPRLGFGHSAFDPNYKGYSTHFDKDLYYIIQYPYVLALNQRGEVVDYHQQLRNQRQGKALSQKGPQFEWMRATLQAQMHEYSRRIRENQWR